MRNNFLLKGVVSSRAGFTLVEVVVALFIIIIGVTALFGLINLTISYTSVNSTNLQAAFLAKEGIEIVKNIRDSNFLYVNRELEEDESVGANWNDGLTTEAYGCVNHCVNCLNGCEADYTDLYLRAFSGNNLSWNGFFWGYAYSPGDRVGPFKRKITITPNPLETNEINVKIEIIWTERGRPHDLIVQENLYQWWQPSGG